ncbi:hypothetical protein B7O29_RS19420 [Morganella morganii]|nr:hypothetical protein [Morganella morganii]
MNWSAISQQVHGSTPAGEFGFAGEAESAVEAKRIYCDWFNRGERD